MCLFLRMVRTHCNVFMRFLFRGQILASLPLLSSPSPPQEAPIALFGSFLTKLWSLWECLVLAEPILLFGSSPAHTSLAVWWLRDFLRPVRSLFRCLIHLFSISPPKLTKFTSPLPTNKPAPALHRFSPIFPHPRTRF